MNRNEKAAMLAELKALMKEAHQEARKPTLGMLGGVSIRAVQAQRVVNAVKHVLSVGLEYSMSRKEVQDLLEDLNREALDEVKQEMEEQEHAQ
ncbi:hypothetical protein CJ260_03925 [Megasphaera sp. ASD88]|uniref:hypothetical protein n=1 Tax=Megasphaera sp. ASD88 TaxID=2027407 RepID=UPI000BAB69DD|nr:hypothetical protein [Megasphaera sp. ASD88]PAV39621.1 hypothetical protein CJ260_03925 [Megasphaera sp. ASD88]